jgi:hypothetical protein
MERREFLEATTLAALVGAVGASTTSGCGAAPLRLASHEEASLLERLDRGLTVVRGSTAAEHGLHNRNSNVDALARLALEALVVADVARAIPPHAELSPAFASRLMQELPVLDRSVAAYGNLLQGMPMGARRNLERAVRQRPEVAMEMAEWIDGRAAASGVSRESRLRLRQLASGVTTRARRQSMSAVIDDTVDKVERIVAHKGGSLASARNAASNAMLASIWQTLDDGVPTNTGGAPPPSYGGQLGAPSAPPPVVYDPERPPPMEPAQEGGRGDRELEIGGILIGAGVAAFGIATGIGAAAGSVMWGMIIGATPGGILLVVGLVFLIIGAAQNA